LAVTKLALGACGGEYSIIPTSLEIRPHELVSSALRARKETFAQMLHGAPLLLIPVGSKTGATLDAALLDGLEVCTARSGGPVLPSRDGLPFSTATVPGELTRRGSVFDR